MKLTKKERKRLKLEKLRADSEVARQDHESRIQQSDHNKEESHSSKHKVRNIIGVVLLLVVSIGVFSVISVARPGQFDDFSKCLSDKGAIMYGAMDWCKYTQGQKVMFGKSFKYVNYHEYQDLPGISTTPTWVINGKWHENAQSLDSLAALTGCEL